MTQQVEISYDLLDRNGDLMTVSLLTLSDGAANFDLEAESLEGEVGEGIASGQGNKIVWQVAVDIPDLYGTNLPLRWWLMIMWGRQQVLYILLMGLAWH